MIWVKGQTVLQGIREDYNTGCSEGIAAEKYHEDCNGGCAAEMYYEDNK